MKANNKDKLHRHANIAFFCDEVDGKHNDHNGLIL